jgi:hypothetical protein
MGGPVALLVLIASAFLVNAMLRGQGATRLTSGAMLLLVGLALGPLALGVLDADELTLIRPVMQVAVCWLGLLFGLRARRAEKMRSNLLGGTALLVETLATTIGVALALHACVPRLAVLSLHGLPGSVFDPSVAAVLAIALSAGPLPLLLGLLAAPSAPGLIGWARQRLWAKGPTTDALAELASRDSWLPLVGLGLVVGLMPSTGAAPVLAASPLLSLGAQLGLALVVSLAFLLLSGRHPDRDPETAWVVLIGLALIAAGVSGLLALPAISVAFFAGMAISAVSRNAPFLRRVGQATERPVVLMLLLMAGLSLSFSPSAWLAAVLVLVLRLVIRVAIGPLLAPLLGAGPGLGFGLLGAGGATLAIAVQVELLVGGFIGQTALWTAVLLMIFGDLIGPRFLRLLLKRQGELGSAREEAPIEDPTAIKEAPAR